MPSVRSLFGKKDPTPAPAQDVAIDAGQPNFAVGSGEKTSRFARMAGGLRDVMGRVTTATTTATRAVGNTVDRASTAINNRVDSVTTAVGNKVDSVTNSASNLVGQAGQKVTGAKNAAGDFASNTVKPGASMAGKLVGGFVAGSVSGYLEKKNEKLEAKAENRFRAANAEVIAALSQPPADSIADRPGVRARLEQDIARNSHGHPRISGDEAVQMARMGQHIADALAKGATLNENGKLPVEVNGKVHEVAPGGFASRALAWHMTAVAANNTELRQQQNPGQEVANDMTNSGTFSMKDPGGRIYDFLNANPQVQGRMSTHFEDRLDNNRKIFLGQKTVQRGYDDFQGKLPGQGGALLFDKMKNGELFVKVEHAGCPGIFAKEGHHNWKDVAVRAPLALNRWYEHTASLVATIKAGGATDPNKISRQEFIDKGKLKTTVSEPLQDALAMAEAAGAITAKESAKLYEGAKKQGLQQVEKVTNYLQGVAEGIQSPGLKGLLQAKLEEVTQGVQNARMEMDSLEQIPELELGGIDRRGAEVHVNLDPSKNPANLPGAQMPPPVDAGGDLGVNGPGPAPGDDDLPGPGQGQDQDQPAPGQGVVGDLPGPAQQDQGLAQGPPAPGQGAGDDLPGPAQQDQGLAQGPPAPGQGAGDDLPAPGQGQDQGQGQGQPPPGPGGDPANIAQQQQPQAPGPQITSVSELQKGMKGVVFRVNFDDNTSKVVKLQADSAAKALIGTKIVQEAGVLAPNMDRLGAPGDSGRLDFAAKLDAAGLDPANGANAAAKLAKHLRGNTYPEAVEMDFAGGIELKAAMQQGPAFKDVLTNPRFQEQLGALMAADAFAGNGDRVMANNVPVTAQNPEGLDGWYNAGNLKIVGEGEDLDIIAIDNDFKPGMNLHAGVITDTTAFGTKGEASPIQVGSMAAASPELMQKEARLVVEKLAADADVQLSPQEIDTFVQNVSQSAAKTMGNLLEPGKHRQAQFQQLGAQDAELSDFGKHKRALRMLGKETPEGVADTKSVREKLQLAAATDSTHKQGYRQYMGKPAEAGDLPEVQEAAKVAKGRNRGKVL